MVSHMEKGDVSAVAVRPVNNHKVVIICDISIAYVVKIIFLPGCQWGNFVVHQFSQIFLFCEHVIVLLIVAFK